MAGKTLSLCDHLRSLPCISTTETSQKVWHPEPKHTQLSRFPQDVTQQICVPPFLPPKPHPPIQQTRLPQKDPRNPPSPVAVEEASVCRKLSRFQVSLWASKMGHLGKEDNYSRLFHGYVNPNSTPKPKGTVFKLSWPQSFQVYMLDTVRGPSKAAAFWKADWQGKRSNPASNHNMCLSWNSWICWVLEETEDGHSVIPLISQRNAFPSWMCTM